MPVREFPAVADRVETGPIQFGDDWPGLFIRGDNCLIYAHYLRQMISAVEHKTSVSVYASAALNGLLTDLESARVKQ